MPPMRAPGRPHAGRGQSPVLRDSLLVGAALVLVMIAAAPLENRLPVDDVTMVAALFAAAAGTTAAMLAVQAARLTADQQVGWLSMSLGCYSLVAIPTATIGVLSIGPAPAVGAVRFLVHCVVVGLLALTLIGPGPLTGRRAGAALLAAAAVVGGAGALGATYPDAVEAVTMSTPVRLGVSLVWTALALTIAVLAARRRAWAMWQAGLGVTILGLAHTGRVSANQSPVAELGLAFSGIRLVGIALVLWGTARLVQEALARLDAEHAAYEEELRLAQIQLTHAAERDHELRSGLAGLAGATNLLGTDQPHSDATLLGIVVASELNRLDDLLRAPAGRRSSTQTTTYAVAPVLSGLVSLRRSSGMDLRLIVDPSLRARGSSTVLAQVITNVLGNVAQHAPGSPAEISATGHGDLVEIRVRDFGPGVPPGREQAMFEAGERHARTGGAGLGLHICRGLLATEGGTIAILPITPDRPGCTVVVSLPSGKARDRLPDVPAAVWSSAS